MAKNNKKDDKDVKSTSRYIQGLNKVAQKILSLTDSNYEASAELDSKNMKFRKIINRELDIANGVSHGSILDFVQAQRESNSKTANNNAGAATTNASANLFTENIDQIYNYLIELYNNKYMEMADMKYICKFIPSLGQAIKITLDHITASDDVADTIKRSFTYDIDVDDSVKSSIENTIKTLEDKLKLLTRLKGTTFKNTLITGSSYIYSIPYAELFQQYADMKKKKEIKVRTNMYGKGTESLEGMYETSPYQDNYNEACSVAMESVNMLIDSIPSDSFQKTGPMSKKSFGEETEKEIHDIIGSFHCVDGYALESAMESMNSYMNYQFLGADIRRGLSASGTPAVSAPFIPDGAKDPKELKRSEKDDFTNIGLTGNYIKYIESRDLVPMKIFEEVVGYYHIVSKKKKQTRVTGVNGGGLFASSMEIANQKKERAVEAIVDSVSDMIMKNFNQKFLCENQEFKKIIADCILAKGIADNEYSIQFIPAKYIYAFKIFEDSEGNGESMLSESLFPGKMLLSFLVAKLLLFVNNTGDKTLVTEHKGPIDLYQKNQLDRAIRQLEGQNITFGDFLSPNVMFNKFNRNANIVIPTSSNGTKLLEFEKLEGKNMDMATDQEEKLEKMAIVGSGVPDSLMEYNNDIQFSRQIVSSNIKYAGYVSSIQADLERPLTEFYRDLLMNSNLSEEEKNVIPHLHVNLPRPKVVSNGNNNENVRTAKEVAEMIGALYYGEEPSENDATAKKEFILDVCKDMVTFFDWSKIDSIKQKIDNNYHKPKDTSAENTDTM